VFSCGEVIGASFDCVASEIFYEVKLDCDTAWLTEKDLAYAPMSPVVYLPTASLNKDGGLNGQVIQTRTIPQSHHHNLQLVKQLNEAFQSELSGLSASSELSSASYKRLRELLHQLYTQVSMDQSILELVGIEQSIKSVWNLTSDTFDLSTPTCALIDKWQAQIKGAPRFYYSVMVSSGDETDVFQVINDIPSNQVKHRNNVMKSD
jgi:hypothetical protein